MGAQFRNILFQVEQYPNLKANENFNKIEEIWRQTEAELASIRTSYNEAVMQYNNACEIIPNKYVAENSGFKLMTFLMVPENQKQSIDAKNIWN